MIIIQLIGGLGNQMFQYALGRRLSISSGVELKIDISGFSSYILRNYSLCHFMINESFSTPEEVMLLMNDPLEKVPYRFRVCFSQILPIWGRSYFHEYVFGFNPKILRIRNNAYLKGYWQSEKYFLNIRKIILNDFTLKTPPSQKSREMAHLMRNCESVSIHIRRGDYVTNPDVKRIHGLCSIEYYLQCIKYMVNALRNPHFFIFSDDPEWVRKNLVTDYETTYVFHNPPVKDYEDLWLMTQCKHNIIANSSFSWWGAWLNQNEEKMVIAPRRWFNEGFYSDKDLVPNQWIRI